MQTRASVCSFCQLQQSIYLLLWFPILQIDLLTLRTYPAQMQRSIKTSKITWVSPNLFMKSWVEYLNPPCIYLMRHMGYLLSTLQMIDHAI